MATLAPNPATLQRNQTQQFTLSGITSPVWTLEGIGTLNQSGLYTAPNVTGSALIRAHSPFWNYYNTSYFTKNADDSLVKNTATSGYYGQTISRGQLNSVGDWVEFFCYKTQPYWTGLENTALTHRVVLCAFATNFREYHPGGYSDATTAAVQQGDLVRFEIITGGYIRVFVNGIAQFTTTYSYLNQNLSLVFDGDTPLGTVYSVPKFSSGVTGYTEVQSSVSVQISVEEFLNKDPLVQYVPNNGLQAWFAADKSISDTGLMLPDLSMNSRHVSASASLPVIQNNKLNGFPAVYWDGTKNPLTYSGNLTMRHLFIVCAYDGATFGNYPGIISGAAESILEGHIGQTKFFDNLYSNYGNFSFFKSFVAFPESNQQAKMSGAFAIYEIQYPTGINLTGINLGRDRADNTRKWKGWLSEAMIYSDVLNDFLREQIYYYFALKYRLWRENADGLHIFPFFSNKTVSMERNKTAYISEAYNGDLKALVRGNYKRSYELPFLLRPQAEFEAAEDFHAQHYPLQKFIFREGRSYPAKNLTVRTNSSFKESGSDVTFRFNYSFSIIEI